MPISNQKVSVREDKGETILGYGLGDLRGLECE